MRPFLIHGPGSHADLIQKFVEQEFNSWSAANYWPRYSFKEYSANKDTVLGNAEYDGLTFLLYGLNNKLSGFTNGQQLQNDYLLPFYDHINAGQINTARLLIAWSQTSLKSIKKNKLLGGKSILEHPTPHVDFWMKVNNQFYSDPVIKPKPGYSRFSKKMINRMKAEYELADYIQVHSSFVYQTFIDNGIPSSKLLVNALSINPSKFPNHQTPNVKNNQFTILYIGRLELWKGVHILLQAFDNIENDQIELQLAGRVMPEIKPYLSKTNKNVAVLGELNTAELSRQIKQADVVVLPSLNDAFGMVIIEAMLHGVPVIASTASAGPDIIVNEQNGLLVEPNDVTDLENKLVWSIDNRDRLVEMGRRAMQTIYDNHLDQHYFSRFLKNLKSTNII